MKTTLIQLYPSVQRIDDLCSWSCRHLKRALWREWGFQLIPFLPMGKLTSLGLHFPICRKDKCLLSKAGVGWPGTRCKTSQHAERAQSTAELRGLATRQQKERSLRATMTASWFSCHRVQSRQQTTAHPWAAASSFVKWTEWFLRF